VTTISAGSMVILTVGTSMDLVITYSSADRDKIRPLLDGLHRLRYQVWFDQELSGGQEWWDVILGRIRACDALLLALSPAVIDSEPCAREMSYARAVGKPILPVMIERVRLELLPKHIASVQIVDFTDPAGKAPFDLMGALLQLPAPLPLPDPLPVEPAVPVSYLSDLSERVRAANLTLDEQLSLVGRLRQGLAKQREREAILELVQRLQQRTDLYHTTAEELELMSAAPMSKAASSPHAPATAGTPIDHAAQPRASISPASGRATAAPPVVAPRQRQTVSPRLLVLAGIATVLVFAAAAIAALLVRHPPTSPSACAFLAPGAQVAPGLTGSCGVRLGAQLEGLDCAKVSTIPPDRFYQFADDAGGTRTSTVYPISNGLCRMSVSQQGAEAAIKTKIAPPNAIVIVDFEPTSSEQARIGLQVRCQATGGCIYVDLSPSGVYTIFDQLQANQPLKQTASDTAVVRLNQPNRLVVSFLGRQVNAWLNGVLLSSVATEVPPGEGEVVFVAQSLSPQKPMVVNLSRLLVFQAT
jgi:TIR domain